MKPDAKEKQTKINDKSDISKVGLVFAYRKDGCTYNTPTPTQTHIFTPGVTVLTKFFFFF